MGPRLQATTRERSRRFGFTFGKLSSLFASIELFFQVCRVCESRGEWSTSRLPGPGPRAWEEFDSGMDQSPGEPCPQSSKSTTLQKTSPCPASPTGPAPVVWNWVADL
ncbi:unnamed protein product [Pleuronectes platessa]|uniref:Uncharacterized protein n=1 Tax=Pleuronectes platessa TaxID=8262 RepID=A0A9N7UQF1_PLEPL|nr:unnamed protein product [Pleuronectes platessa]